MFRLLSDVVGPGPEREAVRLVSLLYTGSVPREIAAQVERGLDTGAAAVTQLAREMQRVPDNAHAGRAFLETMSTRSLEQQIKRIPSLSEQADRIMGPMRLSAFETPAQAARTMATAGFDAGATIAVAQRIQQDARAFLDADIVDAAPDVQRIA